MAIFLMAWFWLCYLNCILFYIINNFTEANSSSIKKDENMLISLYYSWKKVTMLVIEIRDNFYILFYILYKLGIIRNNFEVWQNLKISKTYC